MSAVRPKKRRVSRYNAIIEKIFFAHWKKGSKQFEFERSEIEEWADKLKIAVPDNVGDVLYSFRMRKSLPDSIRATEGRGLQWHIRLAGRGRYRFKLARENRIVPRPELVTIKVPDATPELIGSYALDDEQALLAIVRYNRLIDIFLGLTTYSLQNHLRTTVAGFGQIEIDELYVGIDTNGCHYVIPVQAKGGTDQISVVQTEQDIAMCGEKFPGVKCRAISVQFMAGDIVALFELTLENDEVKVVDERHYKLVPAEELDEKAIRGYRKY
ncbi:MAG: endonuclease [Proteobacteria bacterium]|nr:endonuclease [Pseudomonadota bacterium]